jgi:hypothetical protein
LSHSPVHFAFAVFQIRFDFFPGQALDPLPPISANGVSGIAGVTIVLSLRQQIFFFFLQKVCHKPHTSDTDL